MAIAPGVTGCLSLGIGYGSDVVVHVIDKGPLFSKRVGLFQLVAEVVISETTCVLATSLTELLPLESVLPACLYGLSIESGFV